VSLLLFAPSSKQDWLVNPSRKFLLHHFLRFGFRFLKGRVTRLGEISPFKRIFGVGLIWIQKKSPKIHVNKPTYNLDPNKPFLTHFSFKISKTFIGRFFHKKHLVSLLKGKSCLWVIPFVQEQHWSGTNGWMFTTRGQSSSQGPISPLGTKFTPRYKVHP
jgi:hypothetical protein